MIHLFNIAIRWPFGCLIFFMYSCGSNAANPVLPAIHADPEAKQAYLNRAFLKIAEARPYIQSGDLITRTGNDFTSHSLKSLNQRDKTYSHCGIAVMEKDSLFIYHALGGEWNPDQKLRRDRFEDFAEPHSNNGIGIFRFAFAGNSRDDLVSLVKDHYQNGLMFDMDFDLLSDDRMYCAEFVYKSIQQATRGRISFPFSHINQFKFIGVDDIFLHPLCKNLFTATFK